MKPTPFLLLALFYVTLYFLLEFSLNRFVLWLLVGGCVLIALYLQSRRPRPVKIGEVTPVGIMNIEEVADGKRIFSLELTADPEDFEQYNNISFRVVRSEASNRE